MAPADSNDSGMLAVVGSTPRRAGASPTPRPSALSRGEGGAGAPYTPREENDMHPSIVRAVAPLHKTPRSAKVIQLETRRKARLERERLERQRPRPAA